MGLAIGAVIEISEKEAFDQSLTIVHKKNLLTISNEVASNLLVAI